MLAMCCYNGRVLRLCCRCSEGDAAVRVRVLPECCSVAIQASGRARVLQWVRLALAAQVRRGIVNVQVRGRKESMHKEKYG